MKSALANVGEKELSEEASKLEQAGRDHNINLILSALPAFIQSLQNVVENLRPTEYFTDTENGIDDRDILFLQEKLLEIQMSCEKLDKKTAKTALAELKQKAWPRVTNDKLSAIATHLLHSEFEEAAGIARQMTDVKENQC